jgi:protein phosphatase
MKYQFERKTLFALVGCSGSGKSTFAAKNFLPTMISSTDTYRSFICDTRENQRVSKDAFEMFYLHIEKRMKYGYPVVADSTCLKRKYRSKFIEMAKKHDYDIVVLVLNIPVNLCIENDSKRPIQVGEDVVTAQAKALERTLVELKEPVEANNFKNVIEFKSLKEVDSFGYEWFNSKVSVDDKSPLDIIGDVHGCTQELIDLLGKLGYQKDEELNYSHPDGRKAVFVGDIMDRGYNSMGVFDIVHKMLISDNAYYVTGNHCNKLYRYLKGNQVTVSHGLENTIEEYEELSEEERVEFKSQFMTMYEDAKPYLVFDDGKLVVSHGGITNDLVWRTDKKVVQCCLYGPAALNKNEEFRGESWRVKHDGSRMMVYGHTPVQDVEWINNTINIDHSCVFGGHLCALRYPEKEIVRVKSSFNCEDNNETDVCEGKTTSVCSEA